MNPPSSPPLSSRLSAILAGFRKEILALAGFSFAINLLALVPSLYMLQVYDRVLPSRNLGTLVALAAIAFGLIGLLALLEWVRSRLLVRLGNQIDMRFSERVVEAFYTRALRQPEGAPAQPVHDLTQVRQFLTGPAAGYFDVPWVPVFLVAVFLLHPVLGCVAVFGMLLSLTLSFLTSRLSEPDLAAAQRQSVQANAYLNDRLGHPEVVESMGMLGNIRGRWHAMHRRMLALQSSASDRAGALQAASRNVRIGMQSLMLSAGAWLVVDGSASPGVMIASSILAGKTLGPVDQVIASWRQWVSAQTAWGRLARLLDEPPRQQARVQLPAPNGPLLVQGLTARAPHPEGKGRLLLDGVSFALQPGQILAVVGPSAAGKSTLARCLMGLWPQAEGTVRLDGAEMAAWDRDTLGPHLGYLPQEVGLLGGTVGENIARFGPLDSEAIVQAAQAAGVHDMILQLPQAYETPVGSWGGVLTGGQRQRVALARAMYRSPALLVLDEPNANLDDEGDAALLRALRALRERGSMVVLMTHRRAILDVVDQLLVLRDGKVLAHGPRDAVLQRLSRPAAMPQGAPS